MALRPVILGWEFTCTIGAPAPNIESPVAFGIVGGTIDYDIDEEECGDSLTGAAKAYKPGRYGVAVSLNFLERSDRITVSHNAAIDAFLINAPANNTDTGGSLLGPPEIEIFLRIFPQGNSTGTKQPWIFPSFLCFQYHASFNKDGKLEGSLSGKASGLITPPTN